MEPSKKNLPAFNSEDHFTGRKREKLTTREFSNYEKSLMINFKYADEPQEHYRSHKPKSLSVREKRKLKQNYLQGNFRFFVDPEFNLDLTYMDPSQEIRWDFIVKLTYMTNNVIQCPICLNDHYDLKLPKITKCGHIYCWPCIVKYLSFEKLKCPLCEEVVLLSDLRTVLIMHFPTIKPNDPIKFKLKKRRRVENTIYNAESWEEEENFIRIQKTDYENIKSQKEAEKATLETYLAALEKEEDEETKPYAEKCLVLINEELEQLEAKAAKVKLDKKPSKKVSTPANYYDEKEFFYFYQEASGMNIFLSPLDNRFIKAEYQSTSNFPLVLESTLLEMDSFQYGEQIRKRYKFLDHIPLNSNISFAQIEMKPFLSVDNYNYLQEEIEKHQEQLRINTKAEHKKDHRKSSHKQSNDLTSWYPPAETNTSPTNLKLDDVQAYPQLGSTTQQQETKAKESQWWEKELAATHFEAKSHISKGGVAKDISKEKAKPKPVVKKDDYMADDSNQSSLGDFLTFTTMKSKKKR